MQKDPGILQDFPHGCENPIKCSVCAVEQKIAIGKFFDHLDLLGKARVSQQMHVLIQSCYHGNDTHATLTIKI